MSALYLIDGFNFLHAVVLKGRDRAHWWNVENQRAVRDWVAAHPIPGARLWIVFDQRGAGAASSAAAQGTSEPEGAGEVAAQNPSTAASGAPEVRHAPDADAYILERCEELRGGCEVVVVSADRSLVDRAKGRGARSLSPWAFARYAERDAPSGGQRPGP